MKRLLCFCCCFVLVFLWICPAFATSEQPDEFGNGLLPMDEEVLFAHLAENEGSQIQLLETLPSSVDLSTSPYFPPIKSQEMLYSDVAFSTTYYQFTYEKNKYHQVASVNSATWATPKWTYNVLNGGENQPIAFNKAYDFLQMQGALSWAQFPYQGGGSSSGQVSTNLYRDWPTNKEHMRNALKTRLTNWASRYISGTGTVITSATDTDLNAVKRALNNGKVLQVGSHNNWNEWILSDGKIISYRCYDDESGNPGHSMVIVGYDDNVTCDVNDNGVIESAERGAFKVANCWGTEENNDGYLWVMYDALNAVSAIPGNDVSEPYDIRVPAFAYGTTDNWFTSIDV